MKILDNINYTIPKRKLPVQTSGRTTSWVADDDSAFCESYYVEGVEPYCILDDDGFNTGFYGFARRNRYVEDVFTGIEDNVNNFDYIKPVYDRSICKYQSIEMSQSFTKNDCSPDFNGSTVVYTVAKRAYSSEISQEAANQLAINDINTNGQTYANQNGTCTQFRFWNTLQSQNFTRDNCAVDYVGSVVTYSVLAHTYSGASQSEANNLALADITLNGQTYANQNGTCNKGVFWNVRFQQTFTKNDCPASYAGSSVNYIVFEHTYSAGSQEGADTLAQADLAANGQAYANSHGTCSQVSWGNEYQSRYIQKNDCGADYFGSIELIEVDANTFTASSQAVANQLAIAQLDNNGQSLANSNGTCTQFRFWNTVQSQNFTKNDCPVNYTGSTVSYVVNAHTYSSGTSSSNIGSQFDANQQALIDIASNGQTYANQNGTCNENVNWTNTAQSQSFTKNDCTATETPSTVTTSVVAGTYKSYISQADANQMAINYILSVGQSNANTYGTCTPMVATLNWNIQELQNVDNNLIITVNGVTVINQITTASGTLQLTHGDNVVVKSSPVAAWSPYGSSANYLETKDNGVPIDYKSSTNHSELTYSFTASSTHTYDINTTVSYVAPEPVNVSWTMGEGSGTFLDNNLLYYLNSEQTYSEAVFNAGSGTFTTGRVGYTVMVQQDYYGGQSGVAVWSGPVKATLTLKVNGVVSQQLIDNYHADQPVGNLHQLSFLLEAGKTYEIISTVEELVAVPVSYSISYGINPITQNALIFMLDGTEVNRTGSEGSGTLTNVYHREQIMNVRQFTYGEAFPWEANSKANLTIKVNGTEIYNVDDYVQDIELQNYQFTIPTNATSIEVIGIGSSTSTNFITKVLDVSSNTNQARIEVIDTTTPKTVLIVSDSEFGNNHIYPYNLYVDSNTQDVKVTNKHAYYDITAIVGGVTFVIPPSTFHIFSGINKDSIVVNLTIDTP